jgi:polysaccharide export outer membrane protein
MHSRRIPLLSMAVSVAASFLLAGCMWAPGHYMDKEELKRGETADSLPIELMPITPQLIMDEQKARPPVTVPRELVQYDPGSYRIGAGDVLYVTVWDHPELTVPSGAQQQIESNGRLVRPNGEFFFPYIGNIKAAGMTIEGLAKFMSESLATYIDKPQLDVAVIRYGSQRVYLSGAFRNTTPINITSRQLTLAEALGTGGVDDTKVDLSNVKFTRDGREYVLDVYSLDRYSSYTSKIYLKDGDNVHLSYNDDKKVYVMGEVKKPTSLGFRANTVSLADAMGSVGGLDEKSADGNAVYVIRGMGDLQKQKAKVFQLNNKSATGFILASRFQLQPQDVVYVGPTNIARWGRVVDELLPTFQMLNLQTGAGVDIQTLDHSRN